MASLGSIGWSRVWPRVARTPRSLGIPFYSGLLQQRFVSRFSQSETVLQPDVEAAISAVREKSGFVPNIFLNLQHRPQQFRAFFAHYDALMQQTDSELTPAEKEMIVVVTSAQNSCHY